MGAGASATGVAKTVAETSDADLQDAALKMSEDQRARLAAALAALPAKDGGASAAATTEAKGDGAPAAAATEDADGDEIPASWGWPKEPFDAGYLRQYVLVYTKASKQEKWDEALAARSVGGTFADHLAEKAFANLLLNKEGTGEDKNDKAHQGIDPNAYKKGKWYRFLNAKGDCNVYVHNYTCDISAAKPENFAELTAEEKARLAKLGVYIKDLPDHVAKVYDKQHQIPIVFGSQEACEALKIFSEYDKNWQLLDCTKLKRVNSKALEESRQAIVNAMKLGRTLCVYLGDIIPELGEKICTSKNRDTFPIGLWQHNGLNSDMVKEKIYREDDKEAGQYVVRDGFRICVVLMYDTMCYQHSSWRTDEMKSRIPNFHHMEQVRCYTDQDVKKILEAADS